MESNFYPTIDVKKTGAHLKRLIGQKGYTVRDIQTLLHLACPQPVYRWFKGQVLPSADHLYALSKLLQVHMEELLLLSSLPAADRGISEVWRGVKSKRLAFYWMAVQKRTA